MAPANRPSAHSVNASGVEWTKSLSEAPWRFDRPSRHAVVITKHYEWPKPIKLWVSLTPLPEQRRRLCWI